MTRGGRGLALFARYLALQTPGIFAAGVVLLLLVRSEHLSVRAGWALFGLWVLVEVALFPVTRIAYETDGAKDGADAMVGAEGVARDALVPGRVGYVRVGAELWRAVCEDGEALPEGTRVRIVSVRNLTLHVVRAEA